MAVMPPYETQYSFDDLETRNEHVQIHPVDAFQFGYHIVAQYFLQALRRLGPPPTTRLLRYGLV